MEEAYMYILNQAMPWKENGFCRTADETREAAGAEINVLTHASSNSGEINVIVVA